jgi:hypothetical protein
MKNQNAIPQQAGSVRRMRSAEEMYPLIELWLETRPNQSDFREKHQIPRSVFAYWLKKYRAERSVEESGGGFVALSVKSAPAGQVEVVFPNGVVVRMGSGADTGFIRELAAQC